MNWWEEDLEEGRFGDYRIERKLGEGGMAEVFLAVGLPSGVHRGRSVAIKVPKLSQVAPASLKYLLARFEKEVLLQSQEPIPGVVTMLGAGEMRDRGGVARPYLVMEYLTGGTLAERLGRNEPLLDGRRERPQTLEEVLEWLPSIARTLDDLHRCTPQRLHRDVKPENVLFNRAGSPFLSDFGIATLLDDEVSGSLHGSQVATPGSPGYQAPETYAGDKLAASDQFGLGVTVYEALAGHLPVKVRTAADYIRQTANWNPTSLQVNCPTLPKTVVQAVMQAIAGDPGQRHVNCMTFARALHRAADNATQGNVAAQMDSAEAAATSSSPPVPPRPAPASKAWPAHETKPKVEVGKSTADSGGEPPRRSGAVWWGALGLIVATAVAAGVVFLRKPIPVQSEPVTAVIETATPDPVVHQQPEAIPATRPPPATGVLQVTTDAPCRLSVNGEDKGILAISDVKRLEVMPGEHAVRCVSTGNAQVIHSETRLVRPAEISGLSVDLRGELMSSTLPSSGKHDVHRDITPEVVDVGGVFLPGVCEPPMGMYDAANLGVHALNEHQDIRLEIAGHTDSYERDQINLSTCRARKIYEYLVSRGVSERRMILKGYGAERPIDDNGSAEGRARNRRVEVLVVN